MNKKKIVCRYCKKPIKGEEPYPCFSYWSSYEFWCHKECYKDGNSKEAYNCQCIDADCNDCKYFNRGKMLKKGRASIWEGQCVKKKTKVKAYPNFCSNHPCFVHRRAK
ncbi:MAG: hypothetical protein GY861_29090 [bacterium]|nr:hypothetical protein [bacterium]